MRLISLHGKILRVLYLEKLKTVGEFDPTYLHLVKRAALWPGSKSSPGLPRNQARRAHIKVSGGQEFQLLPTERCAVLPPSGKGALRAPLLL
jgi:hypothetical protein